MDVILNPVTRNVAFKTVTGIAKLGAFAALSILAGKTFSAAGNEFIAEVYQGYKQIKNL